LNKTLLVANLLKTKSQMKRFKCTTT